METVNIQAKTMPTRTDDFKVIITKQETLNTNNQDFLDSNPNPESLLQFRHLGYTNQSTIGDICDNSIDSLEVLKDCESWQFLFSGHILF